jgi:ABC-type sulfate transport system permease subunit
MNQHKYLRAYMAGIVVPTIVLVMGVTAFCIARYAYDFPVPLERLMIFPMAVVPNLWGLWNMLFVASHTRTHLSIGFHGALLPFLLGPLGILLTGLLNFSIPGFARHAFPILAPLSLIVYYLVWKYVVGSLNRVVDLA